MQRVLLLVLFIGAVVVRADTIHLTSGNSIDCTILSENAERVTFRKGVSTFSVSRGQIESIEKTARPASAPVAADIVRLPGEPEAVGSLATQKWIVALEQIPATVIDKGILKNVPYLSHRSGDYEFNVYGDPDAPSGIEIGIYNQLLSDAAAKERCVTFMASLLDKERGSKLLHLKRDKDIAKVGDWTIEITPPTDEDAYGGWWISVYSEKSLELSRASAEEMKLITVARQTAARDAAAEKVAAEQRLYLARASGTDPSYSQSDEWTSSEMSKARPSAGGGGSGGPVYVRGYMRKDGTYVHSYTRSAPGRGGGRR